MATGIASGIILPSNQEPETEWRRWASHFHSTSVTPSANDEATEQGHFVVGTLVWFCSALGPPHGKHIHLAGLDQRKGAWQGLMKNAV